MLTEEQGESIENPDENKLIVALPGSGKTHTFISLVERILDADPSYKVMLVTFTNAAAGEMEKRIVERIGRRAQGRVSARTFASLMLSQFKVLEKGRRSVIGAEQFTLVRRALEEANVRYDDLSDWVSVIEDMGRQLEYEDDGSPKTRVFGAYVAILNRFKRYDLNMMSRELISGLNSGTVTPYQYTHILCDEFQDTDLLQYEWLAAHGRCGKKIAVVGDDDQSIYGWRGSMGYEAFVRFQQDFDASGFLLSLCFRCSGRILHSARNFIENNSDRVDKQMRSIREGEGTVKLISIPDDYVSQVTKQREEAEVSEELAKAMRRGMGGGKDSVGEHFRFVAERIAQSRLDGWAVLARTNKHLDIIERAFSEIGKDTVRLGGKSIFDNEHAIGMISLFAGVVDRRWLSELITGLGWAGESEARLHDVYIGSQLYGFAGAQSRGTNGFNKLISYFQELAIKAQNVGPKNQEKFVVQFFRAAGNIIKKRNDKDIKFQEAVLQVCQSVALSTKGTLHDQAMTLLKKTQKTRMEKDVNDKKSIILSTLNGAKGLQWPLVWIIEVEEGKMPLLKEKTEEQLEEERRLMYVGMTRAETQLVISSREGKESVFYEEISGSVCA